VSSDEDFPSTPDPRPSVLFSRKDAKHVLSNVEGFAKERITNKVAQKKPRNRSAKTVKPE
jgi:hypothetical protein